MKNREEVQQEIAQKLQEIRDLLVANGYNTHYFTLSIVGDHLSFNNEFWAGGFDETKPLQWYSGMNEE